MPVTPVEESAVSVTPPPVPDEDVSTVLKKIHDRLRDRGELVKFHVKH